jgi:hypothetical protein
MCYQKLCFARITAFLAKSVFIIQKKRGKTMNKKVIKNQIIRKSVYMFWILTIAFPIASEVTAAPFTDIGNGTVKDAATGLIWQ